MDSSAIIDAITGVTQKWAKQRKAEERDASRTLRRRQAMVRSTRVTLKEAAFDAIPAAYWKASNGGRLPAHARQIMYAARGPIQQATGEKLDDKYFTQTLLPEYLRTHRKETAHWDVVFDARGHFWEPHTGRVVPLGTIDVRLYLAGATLANGPLPGPILPTLFPTHGPEHRFGAVLYVEKEGFLPLFQKAQLAERYDVAFMSTKGLSVTAARLLVDQVCGKHNIPLLVLHDFDKAGFSILGTMRRDTSRYAFRNKLQVIDLGLRLKDVQVNHLEAEDFYLKGDADKAHANLLKNGATHEEADFICSGQRVELNAFGSAEMIAWMESKLQMLGIGKVIPSAVVLESAYRRAVEANYLRDRAGKLYQAAKRHAEKVNVPKELVSRISQTLKQSPADSWDRAVAAAVRVQQNAAGRGRSGGDR